jgi:hypothetical protein
VFRKRTSILQLLSFVNHANMGDYGQQIDEWLATHSTPVPKITDHPLQTTAKYGFGVNVEQPLTKATTHCTYGEASTPRLMCNT